MSETPTPMAQFIVKTLGQDKDPKPLTYDEALKLDAQLTQYCLMEALKGKETKIAEAMGYAVTGGKAVRAVLVMESALLFDIDRPASVPAAAAIEAIHAYSLVHDDLPCMDDDDLRRGKPTVHRKWDETTAVLAGDALQALAFEMVVQTICSEGSRLSLVLGLAQAAGVNGMVGGQALDIEAETAQQPLTLEEITKLQAGKTGALISWAATAGAVMAERKHPDYKALKTYGDCLGLAFQIADDILDVEGDAEAVGKAVGKDAAAGKATFVSLLGLDGAKSRAKDLVTEACDALSIYDSKANTLQQLARFVISRQT